MSAVANNTCKTSFLEMSKYTYLATYNRHVGGCVGFITVSAIEGSPYIGSSYIARHLWILVVALVL